METIYQSDSAAAIAVVKDPEVLLIGFSSTKKRREDGGIIAELDRDHHFSFSYIDVCFERNERRPAVEIARAMAAIAMYAKDFPRVVTYGASISGFVALNFAAHFGAETAIADSPLFAIDPNKVPWEKRWAERRQAATLPWDNMEKGLATLKNFYVLYDPHGPDVEHVAKIQNANRNMIPLPVRFAGHPVEHMFDGVTLAGMIDKIVRGTFQSADFRAAVKNSRPKAQTYLMNLALAQPQRRDALRMRLLEKAYGIRSSLSVGSEMLAVLERLGRSEELGAIRRHIRKSEAATKQKMEDVHRQNKKLRRRVELLRKRVEELEQLGEVPDLAEPLPALENETPIAILKSA